MKKVIVSGANGFIGSHLCNALSKQGIQVIAIVNENKDNILPNSNIRIVKSTNDLYSQLKETSQNVDCFYHFAWSGAFSAGDYDSQIQNIQFTCEAVSLAKQLSCKRFIFPGTVMEYSYFKVINEEGSKPGLRNLYYSAKHAANSMAKILCSEYGIEYIEAAITNAYGPGSNKNNFINTVLLKLIHDDPVNLTSGYQDYDFIYITDVIELLTKIGEHGNSNSMYYVGSKNPASIRSYVNEMKAVVNSKSELCYGAISDSPVGLDLSKFNISKSFEQLGFNTSITFENGLKKTITWLNSL